VEDICPLVAPGRHGSRLLEGTHGPFDFVPALVKRLVEAGGPTASAATVLPVGPLVPRFGNGVLDLTPAQVAAVAARRGRLITAEMVRPGAWVTTPRPWYANALKDRDQLSCVAPLPWREQHRRGTAAAVSGQMNLRGQASPGPAVALIGRVPSRPGTFPWNPRRTLSSPCGTLMGPAGRRINAPMLRSIRSSASATVWTARRTFSQVPSAGQRLCRPWQVFHLPKRGGRSRQGIPVRWRKRMPLITLR
jgi:hypothetical protein